MSQHTGPKIITDSLAYCIDPGNLNSYTSGSTTLYDISRNGYTGSFQGDFPYPSTSSYALQFDGVSDFVSLGTNTPNLYPKSDSFTWCGWMKYGSHPSQIWYGNAGGGSDGFGISMGVTELRVEVLGTTGPANPRQTSYYNITAYHNKWHQLTVVLNRDGFTVTVYVNGIQIGSNALVDWGSIRQEPSAGVNGLYIGCYNGADNLGWYNGLLGPIHIYRKALSQAEIIQNYNALKGRYNN